MRLILYCFLISFTVYSQERTVVSIYFANDSELINSQERTKLDSLTKKHFRDSVSISLRGFTNGYASKAYNLELARKRLVSVKQQLGHLTIDSTEAVGELPTISWTARRVDVTIHIEEQNIPDSTQFKIDEPEEEGNKRRMVSSRTLDITSYSELEINQTTVLFGIFYQGGTDKMLGSSSAITLRKVLRFLEGYPTRKILITGHICCSQDRPPKIDGNNSRNGSTTLSVDRAKVVYDYLVKSGISPERLRYRGVAYTEPLDWEEIKNRRVEMTILE